MTLNVETLSAELERLYDLTELGELAGSVLGSEATALGGTGAKASFARTLAERCVERDAVEALLDAMQSSRRDEAKALRQSDGKPPVVSEGELQAKGYTLVASLGTGPSAVAHRAYHEGELVRLKLATAVNRKDAARYLVATRLAAQVTHPGLPEAVTAFETPNGFAVAHPFYEGATLREILKRTGPRHVNEVLPILHAIAEPLAALHERHIVHGALHLGNVLVLDQSPATPRVILLDAGAYLLRPSVPQQSGDFSQTWLASIAPETLRGKGVEPASDVYAFGVLVYQLLTGLDPFAGSSAADIAVAHLMETPEPLSFAAPRGAGPDLDAFVQSLFERDPEQRPRDASELLEALRRLWRASTRPPSWVSDDRLDGRFAILAENPLDEGEAAALEASVDLGADAARVAQGFVDTVAVVEERGNAERAVPRLLTRAARLFEVAGDFEQAEGLYERLIELDAQDASSFSALVRLRKRQRKHEALVELFLERSESAKSAAERAQCFAEIGELYAGELGDKEQAVVAFAQAFCEDPLEEERARAVERAAGGNAKAWAEVLERCGAAAQGELPDEARTAILLRSADWYASKLTRPDMARELLNSVLVRDPSNDAALSALADLYRRAQLWTELGQVLVRRADIAAPRLARDLRAEAAEVLATRLNNVSGAEELFGAVLAEDPGHPKAAEGLAAVLRQRGEPKRALELLEARALSLSGDERHRQVLQIAEAWETELDRLDAAERLYRDVLREEPKHVDALRGLDRVLNRSGRYRELVEVLVAEIQLAVTPRQQVGFYERLAAIFDEEYLDPARAAEALERAILLDPSRASAAAELARHYRRLERWNELRDLYLAQLAQSTDRTWKIEAGIALARLFDERFGLLGKSIEELERVLELEPTHGGALAALAVLKARMGDAQSAVAAMERLADAASTPNDRAEHFVKAADLLREQNDPHGAIRELKRALDAAPEHPGASKKLIAAYVQVGHHAAAVELLDERMASTQGDRARAAVAGQMALICHRHLHDNERALAMATMALHLDPTNLDGLRVQGRVAYADGRFAEAAKRLEGVVTQAHELPEDELGETLFAYVDALAKSGAYDRALAAADQFIDGLSMSATLLLPVCELSAEHGSPQRTVELVRRLLEDHAEVLDAAEEGVARRLLGQALTRSGRAQQALPELDRALRLDPESRLGLRAMADALVEVGDARRAVDLRRREIDMVQGAERVSLLLDLGELVADKLGDNDYAGRCFLLALDEAPNDRRILTRLMQLFSAEKDWSRLLDIVVRLAELVNDPEQRATYLHTAAMVAAREIGDPDQALVLLDEALEADPSHEGATLEALAIRRRLGDWDGIKALLKRRAQQLAQTGRHAELLPLLEELGETYERLGSTEQAARVYESALDIEPDGVRWLERLARTYASDPAFLERGQEALELWIEVDPYRPEPYQLLRRMYTQARQADGAWLAAQALCVLGQAQPDESRFYQRFRTSELVTARRRLTGEEWMELVMPDEGEPLITSLFSLIEPYVLATRGRPESAYGLGMEDELDMDRYPHGLVFAFYHGAQIFPADEPRIFQRQSDPSRVTPLATPSPAVVLGRAAFADGMGPLESAFIAGSELAHSLPGLRLRTLLPNMTSLKSWLLGAIRLLKPKFPVASELEASVSDAARVIAEAATGEYREHLVHHVSKLLQDSAALDLKRWVRSVDQAADRAGLILCGDLDTSVSMIRSEPARQGSMEPVTRARDVLIYSVSAAHLALRERLSISVDA
ncbi:MAG TPA: tetratricopeptide repeat protein [Polyangiaceae bacterium]|nr:tetratricopeptide repeat protein [Polyangiaceae bacterium]